MMLLDIIQDIFKRTGLSFCSFAYTLDKIIIENLRLNVWNSELIHRTEEYDAVNAVAHCLVGKVRATVGVAQHSVCVIEVKEVRHFFVCKWATNDIKSYGWVATHSERFICDAISATAPFIIVIGRNISVIPH